MSVDKDQCFGRKQTTRNAAVVGKVKTLIMKDRHLTIRETAKQVEISSCSSRTIVCDHAQCGCEICSRAFVCETEKLLSIAQDLLDIVNAESCFRRKARFKQCVKAQGVYFEFY
ncbi:hypothetical protein TNCV_603431 [Trichonephila clavipes]|nr:hypothetical protein TNCV_603431 [Trichonephila clavipes]